MPLQRGRSPTTPAAAQKALKAAGWTKVANAWRRPTFKKPFKFELLSPDAASNPAAFAAAEAVARDWKRIGLQVTHVALPPAEFVTERLAKGTFGVAVADVTVGLDPDLYPLLASSQTLTGGSNVIGLQDPALDKLLVAARKPGTPADAGCRLLGPPEAARQGSLRAAAGLRRRVGRGPGHGHRACSAPGRRPVGSILGCANMAPRR